MIHQGQKICLSRAFLLLCLPGYLTLSIPRVIKGTVGGTLVMKCQYGVGEEGYRKFWCRGSDWKDCARVIETGQEVGQEVRHGRVTLRDNPMEHHFLVITEDLKEEDVDVYWCGVDGARSVPQAPAAGAVSPGSVTVAVRITEMSTSLGALALTSHTPSPALPDCFLFLVLLKVVLFLSFSSAAICLASPQRCL
ncbi:CMRF35-like molecule 5 isoform X2 [Rhinolophus ferrumequinum]|uniref:CMRF35-like molecule 5 isoform X2 n=1 Tax=Rhinolophus ferrumequinum TaxID=59479 RepID=UPI00140F6FDF|nr:CMRF35-like molecule 5 isoform X2 [Rhinolophus ferrumequinum]